jgi:hypothetical protein
MFINKEGFSDLIAELVRLWLSVLLVEETGVPGRKHRPFSSHGQTSSHIVAAMYLCIRDIIYTNT